MLLIKSQEVSLKKRDVVSGESALQPTLIQS